MGRKRGSICKSDGGAFKRRRGGGSDDEEYVFGVEEEEEEEEVEESLDDSLAGDATEEEFEYRESSCGSEEEPDFDCEEEEEEEEEDRNEVVDEEVVACSVMARIGRAKRSRDLVEVVAEEELEYGLVRSRRRNAAVLDYAEEEEEDDEHDEDFRPDDGEDVDVDDEDIEPFQKRRKFKASRPKLKKKLQGGGSDDYDDNDFDVECEPFFDYDVSDSDEDFIANNPIDERRNKIKTAECRKRLLVVSGSDSDSLVFEGQLKNKGICMRQCGENVGVEFGQQRCGICLSEDQKRTVQGKLDCCAHFFCSACIMEWSKVETRCPVCKRRFSTITKTSKLDPMFGMNKVVRVQTRDQIYQPSEGEIRQILDPYGNIVCTECQQAVDDHLMLLCDICDSCAHTYCVGLGREVPEGNWYCDCCRSATAVSSRVQNQDSFSGGVHKSESLTHGNEAVEDAVHIHSNSYSQPSESFPRLVASQRIDLNAPPTLDDDYDAAMYQVTGVGGSTLSGRRAIHQRIRILLSNSRPRQMIHQNDLSNDKMEGNAAPQEVQQSKGSLHASS